VNLCFAAISGPFTTTARRRKLKIVFRLVLCHTLGSSSNVVCIFHDASDTFTRTIHSGRYQDIASFLFVSHMKLYQDCIQVIDNVYELETESICFLVYLPSPPPINRATQLLVRRSSGAV